MKRSELVFWALLLLSLGWIYGGLFTYDPFLYYDDQQVIVAMAEIRSFSDYFSALKTGSVVDLQPMRDLLSWIDYFFLRNFSLSIFHLSNVIVWIFTLFGLKKLIKLKGEGIGAWSSAIVLLIAVNPLYVPSVSWLSARKHLLAACFIVWASYHFFVWLKNDPGLKRRNLFFSGFFYLLAVLSQPIVVCFPVFTYLVLLLNRKMGRWKSLAPSALIMGILAWINYYYYSSHFYQRFSMGVDKFSEFYNTIYSIRMFALGRYLFQVLVPYWTSIAIYDLRNWRCLVGIFLYPVTIYLFLKLTKRKWVIEAYGFFVLMLAPVVLRMTQIFGSDTYLVTASFGIYLLLGQIVFERLRHQKWVTVSLFVILFSSFTWLSHQRALAWDADVNVFGQAKELEGAIDAGERYIAELMRLNRVKEAVWHSQDLLMEYPNSVVAQGAIAYAVANDSALNLGEKIDKLFAMHFFTPAAMDFLARLEFDYKNYKSSEQLLLGIVNLPNWNVIITEPIEKFAAKVYVSCERALETDCEKKTALVKTRAVYQEWDNTKFESEKKRLEGR